MNEHYPFTLMPLPYAYNALEPYIDETTMRLHHDKHLKTYVDNLNAALKDYPELHRWNLEQLLYYIDRVPEAGRTAVKHNGGGVYNHNLYFTSLSPKSPHGDFTQPLQTNAEIFPQHGGGLAQALQAKFGGFDAFKQQFKKEALNVFGSGYACLAADKEGGLQIVPVKNQDTVLPLDLFPLLPLDVWEHAYYLKHYNERAAYIDDWFRVADWPQAEARYRRVKPM